MPVLGRRALVLVAMVVGVVLSTEVSAVGAGGPRVAPELPVTATNLLNGVANNSPVLLRDPRDPRLVVLANRLDGPDFSCALSLSGDGGRNWIPAAPVSQLPPGVEKCYAPEIAFDRRGRLYFLFVGLAGGGNRPVGAYLTTSADGGRTFSAPVGVLGPERFGIRMAIDESMGSVGRLHLVWLEARSEIATGGFGAPPNPIMASYSDDGGLTFSAPVQVSDAGRQRVVAPVLAIGPDHHVHVGYYDLNDDARDYQGLEGPVWDGMWSLIVSTSSDGGRRFGPGVVVDDGIVPPERVMLVYTMPPAALVADAAGRLFTAWHDGRNHDWDVFVRRSDDGRRWGPPTRVNDDPLDNGRYQYLPRLSVAPGGRLDVVFYDRRVDPSNQGADVFLTSSDDHGRRFAPNVRLTSFTFDTQIGPQYGVVSAQGKHEFGGRLGLISGESNAVAAWTDTRNTKSAPPAQDIFATKIDFPTKNRSRTGLLVLVGGGFLAAGVVGYTYRRRAKRHVVEVA